MPVDEYGRNMDYVSYFSLEEYIERIKLTDSMLYHLEDTSKDMDEYLKLLSSYNNEEIVNYFIYQLYQELKASQYIENTKFNGKVLEDKGVMFDTLSISHKRIHDLHNFVMEADKRGNINYVPTYEYRTTPVNISSYRPNGREDIFWRGANPEDVNKFMNDFIKIYKQSKISSLYNNPFLAGALMSLLFNRIHPYTDGNGRTSRIIYNLKFTEQVNKNCSIRLKLSPLNISNRILTNKITYVNRIDQISFNLKDETNEAINRWFDFILDMVDEQLHYSKEKLEQKMREIDTYHITDEELQRRAKAMRLSRIR